MIDPRKLSAVVLAMWLFAIAFPALGQQPAPPPSVILPPSSVPIPGELELAKLVWSTMAAVDHANRAGNYSVLRDLSAPGFQANNDAARLTDIFSTLRQSRIDLSNALLLAPTYRATPGFVQQGVLRVQGYFGLRPTAINFDLYFQWIGGNWKLFGVSIVPSTIAQEQPVPLRVPVPVLPKGR